MLTIDHISLGTQNLYEGTERLCRETGLGQYEGGWFPGLGIANRIVPLGPDQYIEVESVIDAYSPQRNPVDKWFYDQIADGDVYIGWCLRVDTREELEAVAARRGTEIFETGIRKRTDGTMTAPAHTPDTVYCWQRGLPNVFHVPDMATHAARQPCEQPTAPRGITWMEVGGKEEDMVHWVGDEARNLPLAYNGERPGLYAVAIGTPQGEIVIRRPAVTPWSEPAPAV
ncbi:VOC family protein [Streptomyces sp. 110]|uniref:VOC family protein n=1 Tax=Streptomyces endocoffeicus TaxID=2898945 RepID=A0ABS1Q636_9ACTN|nr:VOC family protein [Streptomyces endocoffeicus]MBL1119617.1 VOC family protein [Streptomyces endocoffeicus]